MGMKTNWTWVWILGIVVIAMVLSVLVIQAEKAGKASPAIKIAPALLTPAAGPAIAATGTAPAAAPAVGTTGTALAKDPHPAQIRRVGDKFFAVKEVGTVAYGIEPKSGKKGYFYLWYDGRIQFLPEKEGRK